MRALGVPIVLETLPPLPGELAILDARLFCGDVVAISTKDGVTADIPFILHDGSSEWQRLTVH